MARILAVDDEASMRQLLVTALQQIGHEVATAHHGREAMTMLAQQSFDLIVLDLFMPEQEGIETIAQIRRWHPALPILVISGGPDYIRTEMLAVAHHLGAHATLTKPFPIPSLQHTVDRLLNSWRG